MQNVYNKQYLKDLKIQRNYLNRFMWDKASYPLRLEISKVIKVIDKEIEDCKLSIDMYIKKQELENRQLTIFD